MRHSILCAATIAGLMLAATAEAIVESKTGTEYPDTITISTEAGDLALGATGTALREKTVMKVDVYTIVSYAVAGAELGADPALALLTLDAPKQLRMDLRRSFSRDKLVSAFREVIEKNYPDTSPFAADMALFEGYFERDANSGDIIIFTYLPGVGVTTELNGAAKGTIANPQFVEALWSVWFGKQSVSKDMQKKLVGGGR